MNIIVDVKDGINMLLAVTVGAVRERERERAYLEVLSNKGGVFNDTI